MSPPFSPNNSRAESPAHNNTTATSEQTRQLQEQTRQLQEQTRRAEAHRATEQGRWNQFWRGKLEEVPLEQREALIREAAAKYDEITHETINIKNPQPHNAGLWSDIISDIINRIQIYGQSASGITTVAPPPQLGGFGGGPQPEIRNNTAHPPMQPMPPQLGGFGAGPQPEVRNNTAHPPREPLPQLGGFGAGPQPDVPTHLASQSNEGMSSIEWKPSMTPAEAEEYTKNSYYQGRVFYHGTNTSGAQSIATTGIDPGRFDEYGTYGPGFYLGGNDEEIAREYARQAALPGQQAAVIGVMLNVKKPKIFTNGVAYIVAAENYVKEAGIESDQPSIDYTEYLKSQGYDAVEITGLQYIVVFYPEQVVVIKTEIVR